MHPARGVSTYSYSRTTRLTSSDILHTLGVNRPRQHRRRRRSITRDLIRLVRHILHKTRTQILKLVLQDDTLRNRDTILGNLGSTKRLLDDHVPPLGTKGNTDRLGQDVDTSKHGRSSIVAELDFLVRGVSTYGLTEDLGVFSGGESGEHRRK